MKKQIYVLLFLFCVLLLGCKSAYVSDGGFDDTGKLTFSEIDFTDTKSVMLQNLMTGESVTVTDAESISALCDASALLAAPKAVSARGYYGGTFSLSFFREAKPDTQSKPYLTFSMMPDGDKRYIIYGYFETVSGHDYPGLYTAQNNSNVDDLEALCALFFPTYTDPDETTVGYGGPKPS